MFFGTRSDGTRIPTSAFQILATQKMGPGKCHQLHPRIPRQSLGAWQVQIVYFTVFSFGWIKMD